MEKKHSIWVGHVDRVYDKAHEKMYGKPNRNHECIQRQMSDIKRQIEQKKNGAIYTSHGEV